MGPEKFWDFQNFGIAIAVLNLYNNFVATNRRYSKMTAQLVDASTVRVSVTFRLPSEHADALQRGELPKILAKVENFSDDPSQVLDLLKAVTQDKKGSYTLASESPMRSTSTRVSHREATLMRNIATEFNLSLEWVARLLVVAYLNGKLPLG